MTTLPVINQAGDSVGQIDVPQSWVEQERGEQALKDAIVAHLGAVRAGTAKTKVRSEVRATGAKPYRQKGTGRARAGSTTSPIWRGGGTVFGPIPRSFGKKVNKKVQKLALRRALGDRIAEGAVKVLDTLAFEAPRTKEMTALLGTIGVNQNALILTGEHEYNVELASRNLPKVNALPESFTNVYQLLLHETVIFTRSALEQLGARIADSAPPKAEATPAPVAAAPVVEEIAEAPVEEVVEEAAEAPVVEEAAEAPVVEEVAEAPAEEAAPEVADCAGESSGASKLSDSVKRSTEAAEDEGEA